MANRFFNVKQTMVGCNGHSFFFVSLTVFVFVEQSLIITV